VTWEVDIEVVTT